MSVLNALMSDVGDEILRLLRVGRHVRHTNTDRSFSKYSEGE